MSFKEAAPADASPLEAFHRDLIARLQALFDYVFDFAAKLAEQI